MSSPKIARFIILVILLLTACTGEKPQESPGMIEGEALDFPLSPTTPSPDQTRTSTPDWNEHSSYRAQLKITTLDRYSVDPGSLAFYFPHFSQ